ncbi:DUF6599 family protein [Gemmatimonadota bacterium]
MTVRRFWYAMLFLLLPGCGSDTGDTNPKDLDLTQLLPITSSLEGWNIGEGPVDYYPDNLYEYLNGAAPRYLAYGFQRLVHVRYELGEDLFSSVIVDIFDMGSNVGAFGLFRNGMPTDAVLQNWGTEGYLSGTVAAAWKDSIFVQAQIDDDRAVLISMLDRLMTEIYRGIATNASFPTILSLLPSEKLVPLSERYVAADLFGHTFLPGGLLATYDIEDQIAVLFFSDIGSAETAIEAMAELRSYEMQWGTIVEEVPSIGSGGFRYIDPGLGSGIAVAVNRYIAGINGKLTDEDQLSLLNHLIYRLQQASGY